MKKSVILILAVLFSLASCGEEVIRNSDIDLETRAHNHADFPKFSSEEELFDFVQNQQNEAISAASAEDERSGWNIYGVTHYYKLKNPPDGAIISHIALAASVVVLYDTQRDVAENDYMMMQYGTYGLYDIETRSNWANPKFPDESYIFEVDVIKYYIRRANSLSETPIWVAEWVNADGYNMRANFPYRFTPEEVLAFVSDVERVEIG